MRMQLFPKPIIPAVSLVLCLSLCLILSVPRVFAQDENAIACMDGKRQAEQNISGFGWFAIGCVGGCIGYIIALSIPNPPSEQLLGKSPEYVDEFTRCYQNRGKSIKRRNAMWGMITETGVLVASYIIYVSTVKMASNIGEGCMSGCLNNMFD